MEEQEYLLFMFPADKYLIFAIFNCKKDKNLQEERFISKIFCIPAV